MINIGDRVAQFSSMSKVSAHLFCALTGDHEPTLFHRCMAVFGSAGMFVLIWLERSRILIYGQDGYFGVTGGIDLAFIR